MITEKRTITIEHSTTHHELGDELPKAAHWSPSFKRELGQLKTKLKSYRGPVFIPVFILMAFVIGAATGTLWNILVMALAIPFVVLAGLFGMGLGVETAVFIERWWSKRK